MSLRYDVFFCRMHAVQHGGFAKYAFIFRCDSVILQVTYGIYLTWQTWRRCEFSWLLYL